MTWHGFLTGTFAVSLLVSGGREASAQVTPPETLAAQLRLQGYRCDDPVSVQQDARLSKPDETVWTLRCNNASYRMRLIPDMAARVEKLD